MEKTPQQINHYSEMIAHVSPWSKKAGQVPNPPLDVIQDSAEELGIKPPMESMGSNSRRLHGAELDLVEAEDAKTYETMGGKVRG
jgi:hypothetical protein